MNKQDILEELIQKIAVYKNTDKIKDELTKEKRLFNSINSNYTIEVLPTRYIERQEQILNEVNKAKSSFNCRECDIGKQKEEEILSTSESVFDAIFDFHHFCEECQQHCERLKIEPDIKTTPWYTIDGIECIEAMREVFGTEELKNFCLINAFRFLWRDDKYDIQKAKWYIDKYIELCSEGNSNG